MYGGEAYSCIQVDILQEYISDGCASPSVAARLTVNPNIQIVFFHRGGYRNLEGGGLIIIFTRGQSPRNQRLFIISSSKFFTNMCNKYSSLLHAHNTHYETIHA